MKAFKAFIKSFEVPQRSVEIKILVSFYFNTTFWNARSGTDSNVQSILYICSSILDDATQLQ